MVSVVGWKSLEVHPERRGADIEPWHVYRAIKMIGMKLSDQPDRVGPMLRPFLT